MSRRHWISGIAAFLLAVGLGTAVASVQNQSSDRITNGRLLHRAFQLEVVVNGRPLAEYYARGRTYVEALHGAEYVLRVKNHSSDRVAVALSVDGLNTIDARHTSASQASKWVIEPYQTITISGWQMSTERARHFYFTDERDSYGAKLGQTANLGVISAVFFRERSRRVVPITPPIFRDRSSSSSSPPSARAQSAPREDAATGIGRSVHHDVRWVDMDLESRPAGEVTLRYEYYSALLRMGIVPRESRQSRREDARGFSPEP